MNHISRVGGVFLFFVMIGATTAPHAIAGVVNVSPFLAKADVSDGFSFYADMIQFYVDSFDLNPSPDTYIPVSLPQGAIVKKFAATLTDNTVDLRYPIEASLVRFKLSDGNMEYMAGVDSAVGHAINRVTISTTKINNKTINNNLYVYAIYITEWYPTIDRKFHGAIISY